MTDEKDSFAHQIRELMYSAYPKRFNVLYNHPLQFSLLYITLIPILHGAAAATSGSFAGAQGVRNFSRDTNYPILMLVFSLAIYHYLAIPSLLSHAFETLTENKIFLSSHISIPTQTKNLFKNRLIRFSPIGLTVIFMTGYVIVTLTDNIKFWSEVNRGLLVFTTLSYMLAMYAIAGVLVYFGLSIIVIRGVLVKNETQVRPLDPDGCGGWNSLGVFSFRLSLLALGFAIMLVAFAIDSTNRGVLGHDYPLFLMVTAYLLLVPVLFYLPLHTAHRSMLDYRNTLIASISNNYYTRQQKLQAELPDDVDTLQKELQYLEQLSKLRDSYKRYPVWPFSTRIRLAVLANALIPAIPTVLGLILDTLS